METPRDHQMNDEKKFIFQRENDALAQAAQRQNFLSLSGVYGRIESSQNKRAADANLLNRLIENPLGEGLDVNGDVGKFGHGRQGSRIENGGSRIVSSALI